MTHSNLKILLYRAIGLMLLFNPFLLDISPDQNAHAMGFLGKSAGGNKSSGSRVAISDPESEPGGQPPVHPTPEPATMLLVGGGIIGLAALKKKFMKK